MDTLDGRVERIAENHYRITQEEGEPLETSLLSLRNQTPIETLEIEGGSWSPKAECALSQLEVQHLLIANTENADLSLIRSLSSLKEISIGLQGGILSLQAKGHYVAASLEECSPKATIEALSLLEKQFPDLAALRCIQCSLPVNAGEKILQFPQLHTLALSLCKGALSENKELWHKLSFLYCTPLSLAATQELKREMPQTKVVVQNAQWEDLLTPQQTHAILPKKEPSSFWDAVTHHKGSTIGGLGMLALGMSGVGIPLLSWFADANDNSWLRTAERTLKGGFGSQEQRIGVGAQYAYRYWQREYRDPLCLSVEENSTLATVCQEGLLEALAVTTLAIGSYTLFQYHKRKQNRFTLKL